MGPHSFFLSNFSLFWSNLVESGIATHISCNMMRIGHGQSFWVIGSFFHGAPLNFLKYQKMLLALWVEWMYGSKTFRGANPRQNTQLILCNLRSNLKWGSHDPKSEKNKVFPVKKWLYDSTTFGGAFPHPNIQYWSTFGLGNWNHKG